jgi:hypothetical protein
VACSQVTTGASFDKLRNHLSLFITYLQVGTIVSSGTPCFPFSQMFNGYIALCTFTVVFSLNSCYRLAKFTRRKNICAYLLGLVNKFAYLHLNRAFKSVRCCFPMNGTGYAWRAHNMR